MKYLVATKENLEEILIMKNKVKERVIKENLPIWKDGYPLDEMIIEDIEHSEGRIIKIDDEIVGYAHFHHRNREYDLETFNKENIQCFGRVMVKDGYVGKHIGDFLIKSMIEEAKTLNVEGVGILVDACNIKAYNLYLKHGFKKEGEGQFPFAYLDILGLYW